MPFSFSNDDNLYIAARKDFDSESAEQRAVSPPTFQYYLFIMKALRGSDVSSEHNYLQYQSNYIMNRENRHTERKFQYSMSLFCAIVHYSCRGVTPGLTPLSSHKVVAALLQNFVALAPSQLYSLLIPLFLL